MDNEEIDIFGTSHESKKKHETLMKFLNVERKTYPQVTEREIELIEKLKQNSVLLPDPLEIMVPTIKRKPTQEQLDTLMKLDPSCLSETYHSLKDTPEDRNIARDIIDIAQKSKNPFYHYESFTSKKEDYDNSLVGDPELTTLMVTKLKESINIDEWNTVTPLKNFLEKVAPTCAKHSKGKKACMDLADVALKREEAIFREDQDSYRRNLDRMFPNISASRQKDITD